MNSEEDQLSGNPYLPYPARIEQIITETEDKSLRTFRVVFLNKADVEGFTFLPGQFCEVSIVGKGEIPLGMASSPTEKGFLLFTVNKAGVVTRYLHNMREGDIVGVRGPLGNWYPWEKMEGKDVVVIGGGFAFTTLRAAIVYMLHPENRERFRGITVLYGARSPGLLLYREELEQWEKRDDVNVHLTVDATDDPEWPHNVGFVPAIAEQKITACDDSYALVCGPPIMIKFTQPVLENAGFEPERIIISLEMRMKCGIGMCGRCNIGQKYVCTEGPVFSLAQLNELPQEY